MEKRVTGMAWRTPDKEDWRPKKEKGPDMASYDP